MTFKDLFIRKLPELKCPEEFRWELINESHTSDVIKWRNDPSNLRFFESQKRLTEEDQITFLSKYHLMDRIDLVLSHSSQPIGVFSIKNLEGKAEYGALIGETEYRGKGIGQTSKHCIFEFWFGILGKKEIYTRNHVSNSGVLSSNLKLGFREVSRSNDFSLMVLNGEDFWRTT